MAVYFTSDLHIGHRLVAGLRGFTTAGESDPVAHDAALAENWDLAINRDDQVWVLGDISAGGQSSQANALQWISQRPGVKHLITGNHDGVHPMHRDAHKHHKRYYEVFESVQSAARRRVPIEQGVNAEVLLSHFPYASPLMTPTWETDEWRELPEFPGYRISPHGEIRGRYGKRIKPYVMETGYHQVSISGIGKRYVHQLVARAYHGHPGPGLQVAHNNGERGDNRAINLRWATAHENASDKEHHGTNLGGSLPGEQNPNCKLATDQVAEIRSSRSQTAKQLAERFGVSRSAIYDIWHERSWIKTEHSDHTAKSRYEQWRLPDHGLPLLHGHVHTSAKVTTTPITSAQQVHVGLDAWNLKPVALSQIAEVLTCE